MCEQRRTKISMHACMRMGHCSPTSEINTSTPPIVTRICNCGDDNHQSYQHIHEVPCYASFFEVADPSMDFTNEEPSLVSPLLSLSLSRIHIHMYVCMYVCTDVCMYPHIPLSCVDVYVSLSLLVVYICVCMYRRMYPQLWLSCVYVYIYMCLYIRMYV